MYPTAQPDLMQQVGATTLPMQPVVQTPSPNARTKRLAMALMSNPKSPVQQIGALIGGGLGGLSTGQGFGLGAQSAMKGMYGIE